MGGTGHGLAGTGKTEFAGIEGAERVACKAGFECAVVLVEETALEGGEERGCGVAFRVARHRSLARPAVETGIVVFGERSMMVKRSPQHT